MPRNLTAADLRRLADELDAEEQQEASEATNAQLRELLDQPRLTVEEIEAFRRIIAAQTEQTEQTEEQQEEQDEEEEQVEEEQVEEEQVEAERRTRPGRRNGRAYSWTVDEDGEVVHSQVAHIYSGEDEPDEVELPPLRQAEDDTAEQAAA